MQLHHEIQVTTDVNGRRLNSNLFFYSPYQIIRWTSISITDATTAMFGQYDYYLNANRGAVPPWSADKFAVVSWKDWLIFNPVPVAKNIQVPTLMIHSDAAVLAGYVKNFLVIFHTTTKFCMGQKAHSLTFMTNQNK